MAEDPISRRGFLATLATTAVVAGQETSFVHLASPPVAPAGWPSESKSPAQPVKIVCTEKLSAAEAEQIQSASKNLELHVLADAKESKHFADAEVILGSVSASTLMLTKKLKWVQGWGAGVEHMPKELVEHPCVVTNQQRIFAPVIAETAIGLLLSLTRGLAQVSIPAFRERKYADVPDDFVLDDLYGNTIGIVGMGGIGAETARRLHYGFGMRVLATDAKPMPKPEFVDELHDPAWLMEMVPRVDVLMSAAPLTKETRGMFNASVFGQMKPTAYFINVSRGGLVDQEALVKALKEKRIRGAGLVVVTPEPLPSDSSLWSCPNVVLTPHNSGHAAIRQVRLVALVTENVRRYCLGLPLLNVVDKAKGY